MAAIESFSCHWRVIADLASLGLSQLVRVVVSNFSSEEENWKR
eukprot:gene9707-7575_t